MADKRMFARDLITSDAFTDMSLSAQALYFHLSIMADDDGFVGNPKRIKRMIGASDDDLKKLCEKGYILPFSSGIVVITHWRHNNNLRKDRYKPSQNPERELLYVAPGGIYTFNESVGIPLVNQRSTQYSIDKDREDKDSIYDDEGAILNIIHNRIDYDYIVSHINTIEHDILRDVIADIIDVYTTQSDTIWINGRESYPTEHVRLRYDRLDRDIVILIIKKLVNANIKTGASSYIRTTTYNTLKDYNTGYNADARHGR